MNTPNDFMIEMGRLFGTGRGGQMNDLEAMQLEAQQNQLMEERARQEAVQKYVMGDANRLPGVQESQVGQNTVRAGQMANDQNARMNPIAVQQARSNLAGTDINNQVAAHLRDYRVAGDTVDGDPTGMAGVISGEQRQKIGRDTKAYNDNEAASAAGAALLGNPTGLASLFKTPGKNGANIAKADSEQNTEATRMPGVENPGVPVQGIAPFTNGPGFNVLQQVAAYYQNATGQQQAAEANASRVKGQALGDAAQMSPYNSPEQTQAVQALLALGGVSPGPATPAPNPLGDAARRIDANRKGAQGGGAAAPGATAPSAPAASPQMGLSPLPEMTQLAKSAGSNILKFLDPMQGWGQTPQAPAPAPMLPPQGSAAEVPQFDRFSGISPEAMRPNNGERPAYMQSRNPAAESSQGPLGAYQSFIQGLKENAYTREPVQPVPQPERYSGAVLSFGPAHTPQPQAQPPATFVPQGAIHPSARNPTGPRPGSQYGPMGDQMQANDDLLTQLMQFLSIK